MNDKLEYDEEDDPWSDKSKLRNDFEILPQPRPYGLLLNRKAETSPSPGLESFCICRRRSE